MTVQKQKQVQDMRKFVELMRRVATAITKIVAFARRSRASTPLSDEETRRIDGIIEQRKMGARSYTPEEWDAKFVDPIFDAREAAAEAHRDAVRQAANKPK